MLLRVINHSNDSVRTDRCHPSQGVRGTKQHSPPRHFCSAWTQNTPGDWGSRDFVLLAGSCVSNFTWSLWLLNTHIPRADEVLGKGNQDPAGDTE